MNPIAIAASLPFFAGAALAFVVVRAPIISVIFILLAVTMLYSLQMARNGRRRWCCARAS
jgi:hypothetical protein